MSPQEQARTREAARPPDQTRPLEARDLEAVIALDAAAAGRSRRGFYERRFASWQRDPAPLAAQVAERDGQLVGFAFACLLDGEFGGTNPVGVLDAIAVAKAERGAGVASLVLRRLEEELAARGVRALRTQVEWTDRAMLSFFAAAGFRLAPRLVLEREVERPLDDGFAWETLPVRSMAEHDLAAIVRLDRKITGRDRTAYYERKASEALRESGIRVSLVAEPDGSFSGFLMARVDYGEFGRTETTAVLDSVGVDPDFAGRHIGRALLEQLLINLRSLRVERVLTEVAWNTPGLLAFLARAGFVPAQRLCLEKPIGDPAAVAHA